MNSYELKSSNLTAYFVIVISLYRSFFFSDEKLNIDILGPNTQSQESVWHLDKTFPFCNGKWSRKSWQIGWKFHIWKSYFTSQPFHVCES